MKAAEVLPPNMMARVYLSQARATKWKHWKLSLIGFAAKHRAKYFDRVRQARIAVPEVTPEKPAEQINKHGQWSLF